MLFDGVCNFCNGSVNWIIRHDMRDRFRFAALQSEVAGRLLGGDAPAIAVGEGSSRGSGASLPEPDALDSLVLIERGRVYLRSTAALRILRGIGGRWLPLYALIVVPRPLRDFGYDWFARRRYRWFGRRDECMVPSEGVRAKFLSE